MDLDDLLNQLGNASGAQPATPAVSPSTPGSNVQDDLSALLSSLNAPIGTTAVGSPLSAAGSAPTSTSSGASSTKISAPSSITPLKPQFSAQKVQAGPVAAPETEYKYPSALPNYRSSGVVLLPSRPPLSTYGFTGTMRAPSSYSPNKETILSSQPAPSGLTSDPGRPVLSTVAQKISFIPHSFNEFPQTFVYDASIYRSIQNCLDNIPPYTVLQIPAGEYTDIVKISQPIHIQGIGKVVFRGNGSNETMILLSPESIIENIKFKSSNTQRLSATSVISGITKFINCSWQGCMQCALRLEAKSYAEFEDCKMKKSQLAAFVALDTARVLCTGCKFYKSEKFGAYCLGFSTMVFRNCLFYQNKHGGLSVLEHGQCTCENCTFTENQVVGVDISSLSENFYFQESEIVKNGKVGLLLGPRTKVTVCGCTIADHDLECINAKSSAQIILYRNKLENARENALVTVTQKAFCYSEGNHFSGKCRAAVAAVSQAHILSRGDSFDSLPTSAALLYDCGSAEFYNARFSRMGGMTVQARHQSPHDQNEQNSNDQNTNGHNTNGHSTNDQNSNGRKSKDVRTELRLYNCNFAESSSIYLIVMGSVRGEAVRCVFEGSTQYAVDIRDSDSFRFLECEFSQNKAAGVKLSGKTTAEFKKCRFLGNGDAGLYLGEGDGNSPVFEDCLVQGNGVFGASIHKATPKFVGCTFAENGKTGLEAHHAEIGFKGCNFERNTELGVSVMEGSKATFKICEISENGVGIQCHAPGSLASFSDCTVKNSTKSLGVFCLNGAKVVMDHSKLFGNVDKHFEIRDRGRVELNECEAYGSGKGNGAMVADDGEFMITNSRLYDESKGAIVVGTSGNMEAEGTTIERCGIFAVLSLYGGSFKLTKCLVQKNDTTGVQIKGGKGVLDTCIITENKKYGIEIDSGAECLMNDLRFSDNVLKDILRKQ